MTSTPRHGGQYSGFSRKPTTHDDRYIHDLLRPPRNCRWSADLVEETDPFESLVGRLAYIGRVGM